MFLGLGTAMALGAGIYLIWGNKGKIAGISAILTGLILYGVYEWRLQKSIKELSEKISPAEIIPQSVPQTTQLTQPAELQTRGIETKAVVAMPGSPYSSLMNWRKKYLRR